LRNSTEAAREPAFTGVEDINGLQCHW